MILIDQFHESLTGEVLWYHVATISEETKAYSEKRVPWQQLFLKEAISFSSDLDTVYYLFGKLEEDETKIANYDTYKQHWEKVMKWFYIQNNKSYKRQPQQGLYYNTQTKTSTFLNRPKSKDEPYLHSAYQRQSKDSRMYIYYVPKSSGGQRIQYTYLINGQIFRSSFNAGNVKEWFDAAYYGSNNELQGEEWFKSIENKRFPMQTFLSEKQQDSDLGGLTGDIRQSKNIIFQVKLNNTKLFDIKQIRNNINKINNKLNELILTQDKKDLQNLLALFKESDMDSQIAGQIEEDVINALKQKNIKIKNT